MHLRFLLVLLVSSFLAVPSQAQNLETSFESSGMEEFTPHGEMAAYLTDVQAVARDMSLGIYGESREGRELFYAVFSRSGVETPAEAHATGKPVVLLGASAHGHNFKLRESLLIMARELGAPGAELNRLLDDVIVIMAPSKNPDGLAQGTRFTPGGADLNRDYVALNEPEMAAYVGELVNSWHPHLVLDGHDGGAQQYGGAYPYNLLYQAPATAAADPALTRFADESIFPFLSDYLEDAGYSAFYWAYGEEDAYYGGGSGVRMGRNYGGVANKLSVLFELAAWHDRETAISSGSTALEAILRFASRHADELIGTVSEARRATVLMGKEAEGRIPVQEQAVADDFRVTYEIQDPDNPDQLIRVTDAPIIKKPEATGERDRPWAYVLPPQAERAVATLQRHNITVERLADQTTIDALRYQMGGVNFEEGANHNEGALRLVVEREVEEQAELPKGAYLVRTGQVLGRLVSHLLEPETDDNLFYWNHMTPLVPVGAWELHQQGEGGAPYLPLWKIMTPTEIPTIRL